MGGLPLFLTGKIFGEPERERLQYEMSVMFWLPSSLVGICQFVLAERRLCGNTFAITHNWNASFTPGRSWLNCNKTEFVVGWLWRRNLGYHALILVIWIISSSPGKLTEWFSIFVILIVRSTLRQFLPSKREAWWREITQTECVKVWSSEESWGSRMICLVCITPQLTGAGRGMSTLVILRVIIIIRPPDQSDHTLSPQCLLNG